MRKLRLLMDKRLAQSHRAFSGGARAWSKFVWHEDPCSSPLEVHWWSHFPPGQHEISHGTAWDISRDSSSKVSLHHKAAWVTALGWLNAESNHLWLLESAGSQRTHLKRKSNFPWGWGKLAFLPILFNENREKTHKRAEAVPADLFLNRSLCYPFSWPPCLTQTLQMDSLFL